MATEQILKALAHCSSGASREINCRPCPLYGQSHCIVKLCKGALSIIDEKQAHNENLQKENKYLRERLAEEAKIKEDCFFSVDFDIKALKADTVKKMQERLKDTMLNENDLICLSTNELDQIAKEILEGTQND